MTKKKTTGGMLDQPKAVWAVAFACMVAFMGVGLVDPILPAISESLNAAPSQVALLFTSYFGVTAVAMLLSGWVSSRIGTKATMMTGLALVVIFAGLGGLSSTVNEIIGFRAGWGLGNALFLATALAVIVASARGHFANAIVLYEAALGLGFAVGPLVGGLLGSISWRGPFFGVAVLMLIGFIATSVSVPKQPKPAEKMPMSAPIRALSHRGLLTIGLMAFFYNWGFFTLLGYAPYPMHLEALNLGWVFFAWGLLVAIFSVIIAPRLASAYGPVRVIYGNLAALTVLLGLMAVFVNNPVAIIIFTVLTGACIGVNNTIVTQVVMVVAPVERSVASSAYGFVRFFGGALAPYVGGQVADHFGLEYTFGIGAAAFLIGIVILASGHSMVAAAQHKAHAH